MAEETKKPDKEECEDALRVVEYVQRAFQLDDFRQIPGTIDTIINELDILRSRDMW